ncbi:MAG: glycosyltransferase [Actinomycetota bacterium]|nr:glycosyltransferase [Actinomycetota bacterium]
MRILFASTQGAGHFGPLIPFIDAALRQGHQVLIVGPPGLKARDYPFRAGAAPPDELLGPLWARMPSLPPGQGDVVVVGVIFARLNVEAMLPTMSAAIEEWRPDVVVREAAEFASAAAAELHGLPHVRVAVGVAQMEEFALALSAPALEDRRSGLVARINESPYLTCYPASVDPAPFEVSRFREPATERHAQALPDWCPGDDQPLVYVSFGSVAATVPPAMQAYASVLEAVAELPVRVLLSTGGHDLALGDVPANVHVESWVDEPDVLAQASAVIGHGGAGTTLSALAAGLPQVTVPLFGDQPANGVRVAVAGAGVVAPLMGIRRALERVLEQDSYRLAARRIADEMRELPPVDDFLELLPA